MAKNKTYYISSVSLIKPEVSIKLGKRIITPSESTITYSAINDNLDGYSEVTVNKIPEEYLIPSGTYDIKNTAIIDVSSYKYARVLDSNLIPNNIVKGVSILGIDGSYQPDLPNIYTTSEIEEILKEHYTNTLENTDNQEYLIEGTVKEKGNHPSAKIFVIGDDNTNAVIYFKYNTESGETWEEFSSVFENILVDDYVVVKSKLRYYENGFHTGEYGTSTLSTGSSSEFEDVVYYPEILLHKSSTDIEIEEKSAEITPSTENQVITENKFTVTVIGDPDLKPENILKDIDIFGITGTLEPYTEPELKSAIAIPKDIDQVFSENNYTVTVKGDSNLTPDKILQGVSIFGVSGNVRPYEEPDTYTQYVIPSTDEQVYSKNNYTVTIAGDTDLIPENIRKGKEIFGITGIHEDIPEVKSTTITPSTETQVVSENNFTVNIIGDSDLKPENIKSGVNIFGVEGSLEIPATDDIQSVFQSMIDRTITTVPEDILIGLEEIGDFAFAYCENLSEINIPNTITTIGMNSFYYCRNLTQVSIPDSVTKIDGSAFYGCTSLTNITIPDSVVYLGANAFEYCKNLTSVTLSNNITTLEISVFNDCLNLTQITIPSSVTSIKLYAFAGCTKLTNIRFKGTVAQWEAIDLRLGWNTDVPATYVQCSNGQVAL